MSDTAAHSEKPAGLYPRTMTPTARQWLATSLLPTAVATPVVPPPKSNVGKRPANWGSDLGKGTRGADGPLFVNTRVQTQWTKEEGGDDRWYAGSVYAILESGEVTIKYDDGDDWTGSAMEVHLLDTAHPLKAVPASSVEQIRDFVSEIWFGTLGCLAQFCECLAASAFIPCLLMIVALPILLSWCDMRTGEIALWYMLDSCLSETTPAFVYTLRAAAAAGARGRFQPQA